jgi:hypothetical protein
MIKRAFAALSVALGCATGPALAHSTIVATFCDSGFGDDGAFSQLSNVNINHHQTYTYFGGANNNADHEEGIGFRIRMLNLGDGDFRISDTTTGEADPFALYIYSFEGGTYFNTVDPVITNQGSSTLYTFTFSGLRGQFNHGHNGMRFIYLQDFGAVAAGDFTDTVPPPVMHDGTPVPNFSPAIDDCTAFDDFTDEPI